MVVEIKKKPVIHTGRLTLKPYAEADTDALVRLLTDPKITETFMVPDYETREEYEVLAQKLIGFSRPEDTVHLEYGIYLQNRLIGFINDCGVEDGTIELGYVICPEEWGKGYASEAVAAVLDELREMGFKAARAGYFEGNTASRRVMEKCGMRGTDRQDTEKYRGVVHTCRYCEVTL